MADKKYYWLKLKRDFFKRHDIQIIEGMPNGKDYVLFYLKLLTESVDHDGELRFSDTIPYNEQMLSTITNTNVDTVRAAMQIFEQLNLIEVLDDQTIYLEETKRMCGSEGWSTERVRNFRSKELKALQCNTDVTNCNATETKSKSKSKSIDKECIENAHDIFNERPFSEPIREKLTEWLKYKSERRESYKPTGLNAFLSETENKLKVYREEDVITLISECMANNWRGVIWERLKGKEKLPSDGGWKTL